MLLPVRNFGSMCACGQTPLSTHFNLGLSVKLWALGAEVSPALRGTRAALSSERLLLPRHLRRLVLLGKYVVDIASPVKNADHVDACSIDHVEDEVVLKSGDGNAPHSV